MELKQEGDLVNWQVSNSSGTEQHIIEEHTVEENVLHILHFYES